MRQRIGRVTWHLLGAVVFVAGCHRQAGTSPSPDAEFAAMQTRGAEAMGVDQYTSTHVFEPLPDGGRIVLQRDGTDTAGVATIRAHMHDIATRFALGDFAIPGFVHAQVVPGTDVMAARRAQIRYVEDTLVGGGQVRITTMDSLAVDAVHRFLAFQRMEHHAEMDHSMNHDMSPAAPVPESPVHEMAQRYTAAWGSQKAASIAAFYSTNGILAINSGAPAVGRVAITASAQGFMTAFPDMVVTMDSLTVDGRRATYHWTLTGKNTGPGGTGRAVRISGYESWTLDAEGMIAQSLGHFDEAEYQRQLTGG